MNKNWGVLIIPFTAWDARKALDLAVQLRKKTAHAGFREAITAGVKILESDNSIDFYQNPQKWKAQRKGVLLKNEVLVSIREIAKKNGITVTDTVYTAFHLGLKELLSNG